MAGGRDYGPTLLRELIVYVAEKSLGDPYFGMTKLNKILFLSDFEAYRQRGASITGAQYQHLPWGPAPQQMLPALRELRESKRVFVQGEGTFAGTQERVVPTGGADIDAFKPNDIAIVADVLDRVKDLSNQEASDFSHETIAWRITGSKQEIPYGSAVLDSEGPTDEDLWWLKTVCG